MMKLNNDNRRRHNRSTRSWRQPRCTQMLPRLAVYRIAIIAVMALSLLPFVPVYTFSTTQSNFGLGRVCCSSVCCFSTKSNEVSLDRMIGNIYASDPGQRRYPNRSYNNNKNRQFSSSRKKISKAGAGRLLEKAIVTETKLLNALNIMQKQISIMKSTHISKEDTEELVPLSFPSVRECNAALKNFGDAGKLLRALKMFGKMRKATSLDSMISEGLLPRVHYGFGHIPTPTLVTYSTLMSRAISVGKPLVALRLWNLMIRCDRTKSGPLMIVPDVKATNILMNTYSKLGDLNSCIHLLQQMETGIGSDVFCKMRPNHVTYNTLLDACRRVGDLGLGLDVRDKMKCRGLSPDLRSYTSLISTVARRQSSSKHRQFTTDAKVEYFHGAKDPDMAFSLLEEMKADNLIPNGVTYCALIDVCGRSGRPDLALKGLRMMLAERQEGDDSNDHHNEVGAWTAAIDACGKSSRVDTAIKLFYSMAKFGSKPNPVTCGSLIDCLLKCGPARTSDTLAILRYMEDHQIEATEVMFTSLLSYAGRLIRTENERHARNEHSEGVKVYIEIMKSLMGNEHTPLKKTYKSKSPRNNIGKDLISIDAQSTQILNVFLVFQEMKAAGAEPDIAAYNALLLACSRAGDVERAKDVLSRLKSEGLDPNDTSWMHLLKTAAVAGRSDFASSMWNYALNYYGHNKDYMCWHPSLQSFQRLVDAHMRDAERTTSLRRKRLLYGNVIFYYKSVALQLDTGAMSEISIAEIHENQRTVLQLLTAAVALNDIAVNNAFDVRYLAVTLVHLPCLRAKIPRQAMDMVRTAKSWTNEK